MEDGVVESKEAAFSVNYDRLDDGPVAPPPIDLQDDSSGDEEKGKAEFVDEQVEENDDNASERLLLGEDTPLVEKEVVSRRGVKRARIPDGKAGTFSSILSLLNTTVGIGILTIPYSLKMGGALTTIIIIISVGLIANITMKMLVKCADRTNAYTFKDLGVYIFGGYFASLLELFIICYTTGSCIGCMIVLGDICPLVLQRFISPEYFFINRAFVILVLTVIIVLPLSSLPSLDKLKYSSFLAIFSIFMLLSVVYYRYFGTYINWVDPKADWVTLSFGPFLAFPLITASFTCHYNVLNIYRELNNRSYRGMAIIIDTTSISSVLIYSFFGIFGYLSFLAATESDLLKNYPVDDLLALVARFFQALVIIFSYPVIHFALRKGIETMFFNRFNESYLRLATISFVIASLHLIVAMIVHDLGYVLSISGSVFGTCLIYILPSTFYLLICVDSPKSWKIVLPILLIVLGFVIMFLGVGSAIANIFHLL